MKTRKALLSLAMAAVLVFSFSPIALADENTEKQSDVTVEFTEGILELVSVPDIAFGAQTKSSANQYNPAAPITDPIIVDDARENFTGWQLSAALNHFYEADASYAPTTTLSLRSAQLLLNDSAVESRSNITETAMAPTCNDAIVLAAPADDALTTLAADLIASAADGAGMGRWEQSFSLAEQITLDVPIEEIELGTHHAYVDWVLADGPAT